MARYADYEVLGRYLAAQQKTLIPMTFSEVSRVIGRKLPASAKYPAWWSNDPSNNPMTRVWLKAGFKSEQVDTAKQRLVFRRTRQEQAGEAKPGDESEPVVAKLGSRKKHAGKPSLDPEPMPGFGDAARLYKAVKPASADSRCRHPLYGALKGYIRIMPGVDLTEPADPDWGKRAWGEDTE